MAEYALNRQWANYNYGIAALQAVLDALELVAANIRAAAKLSRTTFLWVSLGRSALPWHSLSKLCINTSMHDVRTPQTSPHGSTCVC